MKRWTAGCLPASFLPPLPRPLPLFPPSPHLVKQDHFPAVLPNVRSIDVRGAGLCPLEQVGVVADLEEGRGGRREGGRMEGRISTIRYLPSTPRWRRNSPTHVFADLPSFSSSLFLLPNPSILPALPPSFPPSWTTHLAELHENVEESEAVRAPQHVQLGSVTA